MNNFVYITTNLINGKQYIGDHSALEEIDEYLGSGVLIIKAVKKYGKQNFKREILEQFKTKEEAFNAQEKYINQFNTLIPNGYNISPKGGMQTSGGCADITKRKISQAVKEVFENNPEILEKISKCQLGKKLSDEHKEKISKALKGKIVSAEHSKNLSKALKNRTFSEAAKKKMSQAKKGKTSSFKGKHLSEESKRLISESLKKNKLNRQNL